LHLPPYSTSQAYTDSKQRAIHLHRLYRLEAKSNTPSQLIQARSKEQYLRGARLHLALHSLIRSGGQDNYSAPLTANAKAFKPPISG